MPSPNVRLLIVLGCLLHSGQVAFSQSADWPQFLGKHRTGISETTGLLNQFPVGGPKERWRVPGGVGMSGFAASDDRALTLLQRDGNQMLVALRLTDGKPLWQTVLSAAYENTMGDGPRATPTIDNSQVFALTGEGILCAADLSSGQLNWSVNMPKKFAGKPAEYGMASSPLVIDDQVVVTVGAPGAAVVGVDSRDGSIAWKAGDGAAGYSSLSLLQVGGEKQIVGFIGNAVIGIRPGTGDLLWSYPFETDYNCNTATPIEIDGDVLISAGENQGSVRLKVTRNGNTYRVTEAWESLGPKSCLRSEWQTPILIDGFLYGFDNVGSAGAVSHLVCVDAKSGKQVWRKDRYGKGNLIAADGKLLISTMAGELVLAKVDPRGYQELGRATLVGKNRQAPVLAGTSVLLRDDVEIVCAELTR